MTDNSVRMTDNILGWSHKVTILISYDPTDDIVWVDDGDLPRVFVEGIINRITEGEYLWHDQVPEEEE